MNTGYMIELSFEEYEALKKAASIGIRYRREILRRFIHPQTLAISDEAMYDEEARDVVNMFDAYSKAFNETEILPEKLISANTVMSSDQRTKTRSLKELAEDVKGKH